MENEISDRLNFLREMEALGEGKRYSVMIQNEIREKMDEMKRVDRIKYHEFVKKFNETSPFVKDRRITTLQNTIFETS